MADDQPLFELKESKWSFSDHEGRRRTFLVFKDRVECRSPGFIAKGASDVVRYEQIAKTRLSEHLRFGEIWIETTGGGGFHVMGLDKALAREAVVEIDQRVAALREKAPVQAEATLSEELANLDRLRQSGVLSEDEFAAAKQRLLSIQ